MKYKIKKYMYEKKLEVIMFSSYFSMGGLTHFNVKTTGIRDLKLGAKFNLQIGQLAWSYSKI